MIQILYFGLAVTIDILQVIQNDYFKQHLETLLYIRGYAFTAILFPSTCFVFLTFWTLWHIDRELLLPLSVDRIVPVWHNHMQHTNVLILVLAELFIDKHQLPPHPYALLGLNIFEAAYGCV